MKSLTSLSSFKSKFISLFIGCVFMSCGFSFYKIYTSSSFNMALPWLALTFTVLPITLFFLRLFIAPIARTSANLNTLLIFGILGTLITGYVSLINDTSHVMPFILAFTLGVLGLALYVFWYSRFDDRSDNPHLKLGAALPNFTLDDTQGQQIASSSFLGKPALFIFYRGNWCPLCMAQIKEVAMQYRRLVDNGVQVVLVSPQSHSNSESLSKKFNIPFQFLVDKDNQAARTLDIISQDGTPAGLEVLGYDSDTVMPTVVITDAEGKIIFADLTDNYRVRPEPETFFKVLSEKGILTQ